MTKSTSSATAPTVQPWENISSPYFLSSVDNPGVSLGFIDGSIPKPQFVDHPHYTAWCKCNSTILTWLYNSVSKDLQSSIVYFKTARDVWLDLQNRLGKAMDLQFLT